MALSVHVCVYCQFVCYRWLCQYVYACTISWFAVMRFVSTCVCVCVCVHARVRVCTVSLSAVYGFCQYVCLCSVSVCAAVCAILQYLCVLSEGRESPDLHLSLEKFAIFL